MASYNDSTTWFDHIGTRPFAANSWESLESDRPPILLQTLKDSTMGLPAHIFAVLFLIGAAAAPAAAQGGFSSEVLNKVNGIRKSKGLPALQWQQSMDSAAARHSYDMSGKRQMSHSGSDGSQFYDRLRIAGGGSFKCSAENVAMTGSGTSPSTVVDMWMGSQGHRDNMMKKEFTHMGIARAYNGGMAYWTMVLGGCGK